MIQDAYVLAKASGVPYRMASFLCTNFKDCQGLKLADWRSIETTETVLTAPEKGDYVRAESCLVRGWLLN